MTTLPVSTPTTSTTTNARSSRGRIAAAARWLALSLAVLAVTLGLAVTAPSQADATVTNCGGGRCTVYLSKSETRALGQGRIPAPPVSLWWQAKAGYYALAQGHRWFAQQYSNRGQCSAFTISINPAGTQGYYGYSCNWN